MSETTPPSGASFFQKLKDIFGAEKKVEEVDLSFEKHLNGHEIRVVNTGQPIQLLLGGESGHKLHIYPNTPPYGEGGLTIDCFIIFDPSRFYNRISGFLQLKYGETLLLGKGDVVQENLFGYKSMVGNRHLTIAHAGDALIFKDLRTDRGTTLSALSKPTEINRVEKWRMGKLRALRDIYGGDIKPLSHSQALVTIREVNHHLAKEAYRPTDSRGVPGGLLELPDNMVPIIVGDLHGQVDNLIKLLSENAFLSAMKDFEAYMIVLGDAVHSEVDGEMEDFDSSILMMDLIFKLKLKFPKQFFYLRGNHDSFSPDVRKAGVAQGILWEKAILKTRGKAYKEEMDRFYEALPLIAISKDFIACHAAPPKAKANRELLINTHQYPGLVRELLWNRLQRPNYPAGYTRGDVKRFRKALDLPDEALFLVAHNPLNPDDCIWLDVAKTPNHHIVFSGRTNAIGMFTRIGQKLLPLIIPTENLLDKINNLPKQSLLRERRERDSTPH
ncbi:MAG: metallophosphoesterase [Magnetococcales bacterium]|nr:metallophosphoesterase [Magnetococcales bacterium]